MRAQCFKLLGGIGLFCVRIPAAIATLAAEKYGSAVIAVFGIDAGVAPKANRLLMVANDKPILPALWARKRAFEFVGCVRF